MPISKDFASKQYECLRDELMFHYKEISTTERLFVTAAVVYYAWLFTNLANVRSLGAVVWYIPIAIPALGLLRYLGLMANMMKIGNYICLYEASMKDSTAAVDSVEIPGWEEWLSKLKNRTHWFGGYQLLFWLAFLAGTIWVAFEMITGGKGVGNL